MNCEKTAYRRGMEKAEYHFRREIEELKEENRRLHRFLIVLAKIPRDADAATHQMFVKCELLRQEVDRLLKELGHVDGHGAGEGPGASREDVD